jgi:hypothetical protein
MLKAALIALGIPAGVVFAILAFATAHDIVRWRDPVAVLWGG